MTVYRIRGDVGSIGNYGEWSSESLSIAKVRTTAAAKQNPVRYGNVAPIADQTVYQKGDVYLHTDPVTP